MTDIATNSAHPRRLTLVVPTSSSPGHHGAVQAGTHHPLGWNG
jgi:hypothetical protein